MVDDWAVQPIMVHYHYDKVPQLKYSFGWLVQEKMAYNKITSFSENSRVDLKPSNWDYNDMSISPYDNDVKSRLNFVGEGILQQPLGTTPTFVYRFKIVEGFPQAMIKIDLSYIDPDQRAFFNFNNSWTFDITASDATVIGRSVVRWMYPQSSIAAPHALTLVILQQLQDIKINATITVRVTANFSPGLLAQGTQFFLYAVMSLITRNMRMNLNAVQRIRELLKPDDVTPALQASTSSFSVIDEDDEDSSSSEDAGD